MGFPMHHSVRIGTFALATALAFGAATAASAHDASHHTPGPAAADAATRSKLADEAAFLAENDTAMTKMMNEMAVAPMGDVDRDFVAMMVPHHQGAIDMALAILRYGRNEQLKRLAQEIIVTQQQEIAAMRLAVGEPLSPSTPAPSQPAAAPAPDHHSMSHAATPAGMKRTSPRCHRRMTHPHPIPLPLRGRGDAVETAGFGSPLARAAGEGGGEGLYQPSAIPGTRSKK